MSSRFYPTRQIDRATAYRCAGEMKISNNFNNETESDGYNC
jgi:hypothetical protein